MKFASLYTGLGMWDYAADQIGWETILQCEINPFCHTILRHYWPNAKLFHDITKTNFLPYANLIDVLAISMPCQPYSHAGKRGGQADNRYLWPDTRRAIRELQSGIIVFENVPGMLSILQPDSISKVENEAFQLFGEGSTDQKVIQSVESVERRVLATIIEEIESEGYVLPRNQQGTPVLLCIPACATGKVHRRDRIWIVAYSSRQRTRMETHRSSGQGRQSTGTPQSEILRQEHWPLSTEGINTGNRDDTNTTGKGLSQPRQTGERQFQEEAGEGIYNRPEQCDRNASDTESERCRETGEHSERSPKRISGSDTTSDTNTTSQRLQRSQQTDGSQRPQSHDQFPDGRSGERNETWLEAATRLCSMDVRHTGGLDTEAISESKWRTESLKALGNTIDWMIAYEIFYAIEETKKLLQP